MANKNPNSEGLKQYQALKRQNTIDKVNKAIKTLKSKNRTVNFNSIKEVSGVSLPTLYKINEIRKLIEEYRSNKTISTHRKKTYADGEAELLISILEEKVREKDKEISSLKKRIERQNWEIEQLKNYVTK